MAFRTENNPSALAVALLAALVIVLSVITFLLASGFTTLLTDPAPNIAQMRGDFHVAASSDPAGGTQQIRITHRGGDQVPVEHINIVVRASGTNGLYTEARLVELPADGSRLAARNLRGNRHLIDTSGDTQLIVATDTNTWSAGTTLGFCVNTSVADFRPEQSRTGPAADTLAVSVVHTETNVTLYAETFRR